MKSERNWGRLGMKSNWMTTTINDVCSLVTDGAHNSPKSVEKGRYMASVKDFTEFGFDFSNCRRISEEDYERLRKQGCVPEKDDILVGKDGARYFEDIVIYKQDEQPALLSSIAILRADRKKIIPEFLYYTLKTPAVKKNVRDNYGSGSAIPRIVLKDFKRMPFSFPSVDEQRKITAICSAIDSKIQVNNAINKNLEQQAQELFKAWFVTFETFGGKMPSSWSVAKLGDIATIKTNSFSPAKTPTVMLEHYSIPAFDEQKYPVFELAANVKSNKYILTDNSVMISKLNPGIKRVWRPMCVSEFAVSSTEFIIFEANDPTYKDYVFSVIDSSTFSDWMCAHTTGSTNSRQRTTPSTTLEFQIAHPTQEVVSDFCKIVTPMYDMIAQNTCENRKLAAFRDSLLPKLMSGELDVSNIDL